MNEQWDETELAPAKLNLALHVTGRRPNGFHELESLVTFAESGDVIHLRAAERDAFSVSGRFALPLASDDEMSANLVLRARDAVRSAIGIDTAAPPVHIHLEKNLPIASGIGGGSADAAATIRALERHWQIDLPEDKRDAFSLALGADVPMCLASKPLLARGVGETISAIKTMPSFAAVLVNPLIGVSTPEIFRRLEKRDNAPLPQELPTAASTQEWLHFLAGLRNDLEPPARILVSEIGEASSLLEGAGASLVRMSGSGATCFGLFENGAMADAAMTSLEATHPDWYLLRTDTVQGGTQDAGH